MTEKKLYYSHRNLPLKISLIYIFVTVLISILGPIRYFNGEYKYWLVIFYIMAVGASLYGGYYLGARTKCIINRKTEVGANTNYARFYKILKLSLGVSFVSLLLELLYLISIGHFSFSLSSLGNTYNTRITDNSNIIIMFRFASSIFRMIANLFGFYYFKKVNKKTKGFIIANTSLYILVFLFGYGNQKGVSDIVIYFAISMYLNRLREGKKSSKKMIRIIVILLISVLFLFSYMQYLRYDIIGVNASNYHLHSTGEFYFDTNHIIFKLCGDHLGFGLSSILGGYLSQGYYGLSLCLQLPFKWTYGIGSSYALTSLLGKIGITGILENTYLTRMQNRFGRNGLSAWNTIFPWLASDFTFIGVLFFFVLIGYIMAKSWKEVVLYDNAISFLMLTNIMIMILFIPANNQLFHGYDAFISSWITIILWIFYRRRYNHE